MMLTEIRDLILRARHGFLEDLAGATALIVMLVVGLHLPALL